MEQHLQTAVKVNAQVDKGIAPLVEALSSWPEIVTVSSCEGNKQRDAYVAFHVLSDDWQELGAFMRKLSLDLGKNDSLSDRPFSLAVEWYAGGINPLGYLRVSRQHIQVLAEAINSAAASTSGAKIPYHTLQSPCGSQGTKPRNSPRCRPRQNPAQRDGGHSNPP